MKTIAKFQLDRNWHRSRHKLIMCKHNVNMVKLILSVPEDDDLSLNRVV